MYEDDHKIYNNYLEGARLQMGPANAGHAPINNAAVVFNTFIGSVVIRGTGNTIANNLFLGGSGGGPGNLMGTPASLGLMKNGAGMTDPYEITSTSPAVGAAMTGVPFVADDIQGHPRGPKPDVGAQQWSTQPPLRRSLAPADVGPDAP
jgi:poly(beta-D-mannuronate) lyase